MKAADFIAAVRELGGTCYGTLEHDVTGWAHVEDAQRGDISWLRHTLTRSFTGSVIIASGEGVMYEDYLTVLHPSPRDLIAELLEAYTWPGSGGSPVRDVDCGTVADAQDYKWDGSRWRDIPGVGCIRIEDDVTIGMDAHIVAGTIGNTTIGEGCRIGHGCNIGHDVRIGPHTLVLAHAMIGGWARIGAHCRIYMGAMIKNGVTVGDRAVIGMGSVVLQDVPAGETWAGNPARRVK